MDLTQRGMQSIETDDILFEILNASAELKAALSGGIFVQGERPDNSGKEDVVINNLFLNHEVPQTGTSNVNIHVPDKKERIGESFSNDGLLEYPQYTRPRVFEDMEVPEVLLNGDHKKISQWRREQALLATARMRPDLLAAASITPAERRWLSEQLSASNGQD